MHCLTGYIEHRGVLFASRFCAPGCGLWVWAWAEEEQRKREKGEKRERKKGKEGEHPYLEALDLSLKTPLPDQLVLLISNVILSPL